MMKKTKTCGPEEEAHGVKAAKQKRHQQVAAAAANGASASAAYTKGRYAHAGGTAGIFETTSRPATPEARAGSVGASRFGAAGGKSRASRACARHARRVMSKVAACVLKPGSVVNGRSGAASSAADLRQVPQ